MLVRLQKLLADSGVASRRTSEEIIAAGRVRVNGKIVSNLGSKFDPNLVALSVDGVEVKPKRRLYLALNKPRRVLCSKRDPLARRTVGDLLPKEWSHLNTVGRLDFDSEGLLFLTNDGDFTLKLTHPRFGVRKKYLATVEGCPDSGMLSRMQKGITREGARLKAERVRILKSNRSRSLVELELNEGKNREVRRLFESQGLTVLRLQRIQIGPIKLGELPDGKWRVLNPNEVTSLMRATTKAGFSDSSRSHSTASDRGKCASRAGRKHGTP